MVGKERIEETIDPEQAIGRVLDTYLKIGYSEAVSFTHLHCDSRYLANIENEGTLPSLPVVIQLIKICGLPCVIYDRTTFRTL